MEEIDLNNKVQNVKIKSILNNSRSSSRNRRNSSSKHVVIIEPTDVKKKSLDLDDKRKIKIKKKFNQNRRKNLSNQNILIEKTNKISNNTNYSNYENNEPPLSFKPVSGEIGLNEDQINSEGAPPIGFGEPGFQFNVIQNNPNDISMTPNNEYQSI